MELEILHRPATADAGRPPLLLIHGSYCAAWVWAEHYLPFFAAHGYPCSAVSLRGHGPSPGDVEVVRFADHVADVAELVSSLGRPVLISHSFGGLIAQHVVAAGHPVSGLVMLASTPPSGLGSCSLHMMARAPDVLLQLWLLQNFGPAAVSAPVMHRALFSPATPRLLVEAILPLLQRESHWLALELLAPPQLRPPPDGAVPALVVGGDADIFLPVRAFDQSAARWRAEKPYSRGRAARAHGRQPLLAFVRRHHHGLVGATRTAIIRPMADQQHRTPTVNLSIAGNGPFPATCMRSSTTAIASYRRASLGPPRPRPARRLGRSAQPQVRLSSETQLADVLQDTPEARLRGEAHGSSRKGSKQIKHLVNQATIEKGLRVRQGYAEGALLAPLAPARCPAAPRRARGAGARAELVHLPLRELRGRRPPPACGLAS